MKAKAKKFIGPSKRMAEALEAEGLYVKWPSVIKGEEDLAIEGTFTTGEGWEKLVTIDLRDKLALGTKAGVDNAISYELTEAYEAFDVDEELKLNLGANGAPDAERLLEDMKEQEKCLKRFSDVADAVASGRPLPVAEDEGMVTFTLTLDEANALARFIDGAGTPAVREIGKKLIKQMGE